MLSTSCQCAALLDQGRLSASRQQGTVNSALTLRAIDSCLWHPELIYASWTFEFMTHDRCVSKQHHRVETEGRSIVERLPGTRYRNAVPPTAVVFER